MQYVDSALFDGYCVSGSRSPSHRRSSRRPNKSSDIEERRRSESSDRRQRDSAGGDVRRFACPIFFFNRLFHRDLMRKKSLVVIGGNITLPMQLEGLPLLEVVAEEDHGAAIQADLLELIHSMSLEKVKVRKCPS